MCVWTQAPLEHHTAIEVAQDRTPFLSITYTLLVHMELTDSYNAKAFFTRDAVRLCLVLNVSFRFWLRTLSHHISLLFFFYL